MNKYETYDIQQLVEDEAYFLAPVQAFAEFEEDFGINEDYILIYNKWIKLTTCLDEYIYMGVEPLTNAQQETLLKLGYKIEEFDI